MSLLKNTSLLSVTKFPAFIRGNPDFDKLKRFVQSYFESLEVPGAANHEITYARENSDIDTASADFLDRFYKTICPNLPKNILADKRLLMKHSKELYESKGTIESFKLLFRILFNEEVNLRYPSENVLMASDGRWNTPVVIHLQIIGVPEATILNSIGLDLFCTNSTGIVRNKVKSIKRLEQSNYYEMTIDKNKNINFLIGDSVKIGTDFYGTVMPSTSDVKILKPGKKFKLGELIPLNMGDGKGTIAKISSLGTNGSIKKLKIIKFGTGYQSDFTLTLDPYSRKTTVPVLPPVIEGDLAFVEDSTNGYSEYGYIMKTGSFGGTYDYFAENYCGSDYVASILQSFGSDTPPTTDVTLQEDVAILSVSIGPVLKYPGFWAGNRGKLSDPLICIRDSDFYQNFSYVLESQVQQHDYKKVVTDTLHPIGMKMYSELLLTTKFDVSSIISNVDGMKVNMYLNDIVDVPDHKAYHLTKPFFDSTSPSDFKNGIDDVQKYITAPKYFNVFANDDTAPYSDSSYTSELYVEDIGGIAKFVNQQKYDSVTQPEAISFDGSRTLNDFTNIIDSPEKTLTTVYTDSNVVPVEGAPYSPFGYVEEGYSETSDGISIKIN